MSPKELLYIEDALGHAQFMQTKCNDIAQQLQDNELKTCVQQLATKNQELFGQFFNLI